MPKDTMTVRVEARTRKALDGIAAALDRDRSYIVNQAIEAYVDVHKWQIEHIRQGLRKADAGQFAAESDVRRTIARLRRK